MNKFIVVAFACLALFAVAQGAAAGQIKDVAFELDGQEYHLHPIEKRETVPDEVGAKHNNNPKCQTIDLPATLSLKVCGCRNPGCPSCPCNRDNDSNNYDDKKDKKNNGPKTRAHFAPRWGNLRH